MKRLFVYMCALVITLPLVGVDLTTCIQQRVYKSTLIHNLQTYRMEKRLQHRLSAYSLAGDLLQFVHTLPDDLDEARFQEAFANAYFLAHHDLYFRHPDVDLLTLQEITTLLGIEKLPMPTRLDVKYGEVVRWEQHMHPQSIDAHLVATIKEGVKLKGSHGDFKQIQSWDAIELD